MPSLYLHSPAMPTPSISVVDDTCRAACKSMKLMSKQLLVMSSSYAKLPFDKSGDEILEVLSVTMKSVSVMQDSLTKAALSMKLDMQHLPNTQNTQDTREFRHLFPDTVVVTAKEYALLNAAFLEYTAMLSGASENYSLFSSVTDMCSAARPCQDNAEKLNGS